MFCDLTDLTFVSGQQQRATHCGLRLASALRETLTDYIVLQSGYWSCSLPLLLTVFSELLQSLPGNSFYSRFCSIAPNCAPVGFPPATRFVVSDGVEITDFWNTAMPKTLARCVPLAHTRIPVCM